MSALRVPVEPEVMDWARRVAYREDVPKKFAGWLGKRDDPTLKQLTDFANSAGIPFGYLLRSEPPPWTLPIKDFREGHAVPSEEPSADLMQVVRQSIQRQEWYRDYSERTGLGVVEVVGVASGWDPARTAADMLEALDFAVPDRVGNWNDTRKKLLQAFEALGGLTVVTSMVGNNNQRMLDPDEFRGFSLVDPVAPLIFVNANQTLNGQIFTIAHELAHVWRGVSGIGDETPGREAQGQLERWCNAVASQFLVPEADLEVAWNQVADLPLDEALDTMGRRFKCGVLVILQALSRYGIVHFDDFDVEYRRQEERLRGLAEGKRATGGDHYRNQPFRVGDRLSRAIIRDTLGGATSYTDAMRLMSMRSAVTFDRYARELGEA